VRELLHNASKCSGVLQCVAVCCSVLQYVAMRCNVLQRVAVCCGVEIARKFLHNASDALSSPLVLFYYVLSNRDQ